MFVPTCFTAYFGSERVVGPLLGAIITPNSKVIVHTWPFRVFLGQHPPLDAADNNVKDGIDDLAHIQRTRSST